MMIGGVSIDCGHHLVGHSDADVLLHAITDALLGAAGLGDIGGMFPNTSDENRNRSSSEMLQIAWEQVRSDDWSLANLDCVLESEVPKISKIRSAVIEHIALLLSVSPSQIFVKGKTGEGCGPVGRGELAEATCVALLRK